MKLGKPTPHENHFVQSAPRIRMVRRDQTTEAGFGETVLILQEMRFDGGDKPFWSDVQIVEEE
jgi:hypothetical protein